MDDFPDFALPDIAKLPDNPFDDPTFNAMAKRLEDRVQQLKDDMPKRNMTPYLRETWEYMGIRCGIGGTAQSGCGYVQLPPPLRSAWAWYDDLPYERLDAHGGLTYGVDGAGWIGFDTGHSGDYWEVDNLGPLLDRIEYEELLHVHQIYEETPDGDFRRRWQRISWTVPLLKAATMDLAQLVFQLDHPRMLPAGPSRLALPAGYSHRHAA